MYYNPVGYALGLLDELDEAERAGRDEVAEGVLEELAAVRGELRFSEEDVQGMSDEGKAAWSVLRARLGAFDAGRSGAASSHEPGGVGGESATEDPRAGKGRPRTAKSIPAPESAVPPPAR